MRNLFLATAAASAMLIGTASAADLYAPEPYVAPTVEPVTLSPFAGPYIGAFIGWGGAQFDGVFDSSEGIGDEDSEYFDDEHDDHFTGGVYVGYNWVMSNLMVGVEADVSYLGASVEVEDEDANDSAQATTDWLTSARLRAGFAADNFLIYGTGGVALAFSEIELDDDGAEGSDDFTSVGLVAGVGTEYAFTQNLAMRLEGLFYVFGDGEDYDEDELTEDQDEGDFIDVENVWQVRAGLTYNF